MNIYNIFCKCFLIAMTVSTYVHKISQVDVAIRYLGQQPIQLSYKALNSNTAQPAPHDRPGGGYLLFAFSKASIIASLKHKKNNPFPSCSSKLPELPVMPHVSADVACINVTHSRTGPNVLQIGATLARHIAVRFGRYCYNQRGVERDGEVLQMGALVHDAAHEPDCLLVALFLFDGRTPELVHGVIHEEVDERDVGLDCF